MIDARVQRWEGYKLYHVAAMKSGDCDPQYPVLCYVADRTGMSDEQRFWLAYLFSLCYCAPTALYMFTEFPDYENVDIERVEAWWRANKKRLLFQTDRKRVRNFDCVVPSMASYRHIIGESQVEAWSELIVPGDPKETYRRALKRLKGLYYYGRFSLFLLTEGVHYLTGFPMAPDRLELRNAESCRNGVCYAVGFDDWVRRPIPASGWDVLERAVQRLELELVSEWPDLPINLWNIETTLCAWKKLFWSKRYFGYYIDRQQEEIMYMQRTFPNSFPWKVLWEARRECFRPELLGEVSGWEGIRSDQLDAFVKTGRIGNGMEHLAEYRDFARKWGGT